MIKSSTIKIPHGIANPEENLLYVVGRDHCIHCLDLSTGQPHGQTDFVATPLLSFSGALIGWRTDTAGAIMLFALATARKTLEQMWERPIPLPSWLKKESFQAEQFKIGAHLEEEKERQVAIDWEVHTDYGGGAAPSMQIEMAASHNEGGVVYLDLETGGLIGQKSEPVMPSPQTGLPTSVPPQRLVPYRSGDSWATQAWQVDTTETFLLRQEKSRGVSLAQKMSDVRAAPHEIPLLETAGGEVAVTPDGRWIFICDEGKTPYWHIYSAVTGDELGHLPFDRGTQELAIVGEQVIYLTVEDVGGGRRKTLCCRHLLSGESMWAYLIAEEIRPRAYPPRE